MHDSTVSNHFSQTLESDYVPNFTQIPNIIFDYWIPRLKPNAIVILFVICRKTYGWHEDSEYISKNELCLLSGLSKNTVQSAIEELEKVGLLIKHQSKNRYGHQPNNYSLTVKKPKTLKHYEADQNLGGGRSNFDPGGVGGVGQILTPYINKDLSKETKDIDMARAPISVSFGQYVKFKEGDYEKLCEKYGKDRVDEEIEELNDYLPNKRKDKQYNDHAAVIRTWIRKAEKEKGIEKSTIKDEEAIQMNKRAAEEAEAKLRNQFTGRVHFTANLEMCILVNANKDLTKKYAYDSLEPKLFLENLVKDLENNFRDVRKILKG